MAADRGNRTSRPTQKSHCVLVVEPLGQFFGGKKLGLDSDINTILWASQARGKNPYLGFSIDLPLSASNEESGFGQTHEWIFEGKPKIRPTNFLRIKVKFPRGNIDIAVEELDQGRHSLFGYQGHMSQVQIRLQPGSRVDVEGFGIPFENPGHAAEEWLKHPAFAPVVGGKTLLDLIQQDSFTFIAKLHAEFIYPYGNEHHWDINRYLDQLRHIKGPQFAPSWSYDDDNSHLTAVTQSQVQDVMWLYVEALEISNERRPAYFVSKPATPNESPRYYVIVKMDPEFWDRFRDDWHHLARRYRLSLLMHDVPGELPRAWPARIQNLPEHIDALNQHPVPVNDLVLEVTRSLSPQGRVNEFESRFNLRLHETKAKVDAICTFHPDAIPTNDFAGDQDLVAPESHYTKLMMSLHRDLMRGQGFWRTMIHGVCGAMGQATLDDNEAKRMHLEALPCVNLLKGPNEEWINALMMQVPGPDRTRFRRYMSERPLGLGLITILTHVTGTVPGGVTVVMTGVAKTLMPHGGAVSCVSTIFMHYYPFGS
ncbi:DNA helicase [Fusarium albosuccineum]|uniref:DNA helicase n=1 Tax=Fusarium albosuccineum TaxID=1237068 RepID=A0A8H4PBU6_9HYPO|nr:DNA helicase [Fusarium albosuccineum]